MKINPDDPWYPTWLDDEAVAPGVTIRLKLAAMAMQGVVTGCWMTNTQPVTEAMLNEAFTAADAMIARANRDEGKPN